MMNKTWRDEDLSAYLDGELDAETHAALEAALVRDAALQRRVRNLRRVVNFIRKPPLLEPPRNYLLTPAMVAEQVPAPVREERHAPRLPLWVMRLATATMAVAFILTLGLNLLGEISPTMVLQEERAATLGEAQPQAAQLETPATDATMLTAPVEEAVEPEAPVEDTAPDRKLAGPTATPDESTEKAVTELTERERMALEPAPPEAPPGMGGVGGGAEAPEAPEEEELAEAATLLPTPDATPQPEGTPDDVAPMVAPEEHEAPPGPAMEEPQEVPEEEPVLEAPLTPEVATPAPRPAPDDEVEMVAPLETPLPQPPVQRPPDYPPPVPMSVVALLGALTLLLGGITYWLSRQRS